MSLIIGISTALLVGMEVVDTTLQQVPEEDVTDVCLGLWGCGGPSGDIMGLIGITVILVVFVVMLTHLTSRRGPREQDDLDDVKGQYVDGDIGILELEEQLEDEMDGEDNEWG